MWRLVIQILAVLLRIVFTLLGLAGVVVLINLNILLGLALVGSLAVGVWYVYRRGHLGGDRRP